MHGELQQRAHDAEVALVDGDVQRRLAAAVARAEVGAGGGERAQRGGLVAEGGVVRGAVAVAVLRVHVRARLHQRADHFHVTVLCRRLSVQSFLLLTFISLLQSHLT